MKVLVLGVTGMLGNAVFRKLSEDANLSVYGTTRGRFKSEFFNPRLLGNIIADVNVESADSLIEVFANLNPDLVINCIGLVKQLADANNPLLAVPINTLLPHRLAKLCKANSSRLIHISTDCVFSGSKGYYSEADFPDAYDLYGRSKFLGEVDYENAVTLRTSIIGHELSGRRSLLNWFLSEEGSVKGYTKAIFSGLPTVELANVIKDYVLPNQKLHGLYHVASKPINKFELLQLIARTYKKNIEIIPSSDLVIDRSLNANRFNQEVGYAPPEWSDLIECMFEFH